MERKVIVIVGPTCSGKSDIAFNIAKKFDTEIISADSRQIYKQLNIGTAKPSNEQLRLVKHHFINELDLENVFDASKFEIKGLKIIEELFSKNKLPIVCGGTGLYIKALIDGIISTVPNDITLRQDLLNKRLIFGNEYIYNELKKVDPKAAEKMLPQNWKRIIRALEVFHITGNSILDIQKNLLRDKNIVFLQFGLRWNREILYNRINKRVNNMIEAGLVEEVKKILEMGYDKNLFSLNTVGYKEIIDYLEGKFSIDKAIELIKRNTRRYAKKQFTWFNKDKRIFWLDINDKSEFDSITNKIIDISQTN
ncbi:MAG: tRNA (adenosine(37)-N6)-dimethylallyltransferase MiaA [Melioribacteraceae bacterium]|nr:tRNA (adenosine(37)-N6)-dimethylallyltransferase MiaA [Melioribacteraceae bacterium]